MKIAFLTAREMPELTPYDQKVIRLLKDRGIESEILFWEDLLKKNKSFFQKYKLIVFRTVWDYYKKAKAFGALLDVLETSGVPTANPIDIIRWNMEKGYLKKLMEEGYDVIPTLFFYENPEAAFAEVQKTNWKKIVLKPTISAGSYHTFVLDADDKTSFDKYISEYYQNRPFMLQEFIPDISKGEVSTLTFSNGYTFSVTKVPQANDYRVQIKYGGRYSAHKTPEALLEVAKRLFERQGGKTLYQRLDGVWHNGQFLIMEVELIEPDLYLNLSNEALQAFTDSLMLRMGETER